MTYMRKGSTSWLNSNISLRVVIALAVALGVLAAVVIIVVEFSAKKLLNEQMTSVVAAIESGPVQFAYFNSQAVAEEQLQKLLRQLDSKNHYFSSAKVLSGQNAGILYASWESDRHTPKKCLISFKKEVVYNNAMYPYVILLNVDECKAVSRYREIEVYVCIALASAFFLLILLTYIAISPLISSVNFLRKYFASSKAGANAYKNPDISAIQYLPLREIALQVIASKAFERDAAIAKTTQMLAHDVRRPFSMLKMAMDAIRSTSSLSAAHRITETMLPEVEQAMLSVNGLIEDVMEVGGSGNLVLEDADPVALVQRCIDEALRVHPKSEFTLERTWNHSTSVRCDERKVARVFSNITGNAIQAMPSCEQLWIRTRNTQNVGTDFIEFVIGNSGSFIDPESLPQLFEAFFTKNKKGGTGLGLAIAHKIVTSHGGAISCRSERNDAFPSGMVEFTFTLPAGVPIERTGQNSSTTAQVLRAAYAVEAMPIPSEALGANPFAEDERRLEGEVERSLNGSARRLEVLIVDDERLYREGLKNQLGVASSLQRLLNIALCESADEAISFISRHEKLDLAILDVDIGSAQVNGFDLARSIRNQFPTCIICIHSNRNLASDHRTALEHGADAFQPKPMVRPHLLKLLLQAGKGLPCSSHQEPPAQARRIAVVDDSMAIQISWEMKLGAAEADFFSSPEEFFAHAEQNAGYLESLLCVVSDYHFGNESSETGATFALSFRAVSNVTFLLSSDQDFQNRDFGQSVTGVIPKTPLKRDALVEIIHSCLESTKALASR